MPHTAPPDATAPDITARMVRIPGGTFTMGSDSDYPEEAPTHPVTVDGFWTDHLTVTNRELTSFVDGTGYATVAERAPDPDDYADARPELLVPGSAVLQPPAGRVSLDDPYSWWGWVAGADWRHPRSRAAR